MPVRVASKQDYAGTLSPSALNTEYDVVNIGAQSDDYLIEGYLDLGELAGGDAVVLKEYLAVDGTNFRLFNKATLEGPLEVPVVRYHTKLLYKNVLYKLTLTQTKGTLRSFPYAFILQVLEVV